MLRTFFSAGVSHSEEESEEDREEQRGEDPIQQRIIYNDNNLQFAIIDSKIFIEHVPNWSSQREPNLTQIQKYYNNLKLKRKPLGTVTIALLKDKYLLEDGQHRKAAIEKMRADFDDFDVSVFAIIYKVESEEEVFQLWKDVNESHPLQPRDTPNMVVVKAMDKLVEHFASHSKKEPIKDVEGDRSRCYPFISKRKLATELKSIVCEKPHVTTDGLYDAIKKCNNRYKRIIQSQGWKKVPHIRPTITTAAKEKAEKSEFYLGLDEKWSWLHELENMLGVSN